MRCSPFMCHFKPAMTRPPKPIAPSSSRLGVRCAAAAARPPCAIRCRYEKRRRRRKGKEREGPAGALAEAAEKAEAEAAVAEGGGGRWESRASARGWATH